jgi:hypothetical protein
VADIVAPAADLVPVALATCGLGGLRPSALPLFWSPLIRRFLLPAFGGLGCCVPRSSRRWRWSLSSFTNGVDEPPPIKVQQGHHPTESQSRSCTCRRRRPRLAHTSSKPATSCTNMYVNASRGPILPRT